jgi:hypothetical protein
MTVSLRDGIVFLEGHAPVEDAATLAQHLALQRQAPVDWSECDSKHAAVLQVLLAARPPLRGAPRDVFLLTHLAPLLAPPLTEPDRSSGGQVNYPTSANPG